MAELFHWFVEYIVPYLNFLIFLAILVYFAKKPLSHLASKRKSTFEAHFKAASEALESAKKQFDILQKYGYIDYVWFGPNDKEDALTGKKLNPVYSNPEIRIYKVAK